MSEPEQPELSTTERIAITVIEAQLITLAGGVAEESINSAYRQLAKLHHTDQPGGDRARFERLTLARDRLLANTRRQATRIAAAFSNVPGEDVVANSHNLRPAFEGNRQRWHCLVPEAHTLRQALHPLYYASRVKQTKGVAIQVGDTVELVHEKCRFWALLLVVETDKDVGSIAYRLLRVLDFSATDDDVVSFDWSGVQVTEEPQRGWCIRAADGRLLKSGLLTEDVAQALVTKKAHLARTGRTWS